MYVVFLPKSLFSSLKSFIYASEKDPCFLRASAIGAEWCKKSWAFLLLIYIAFPFFNT